MNKVLFFIGLFAALCLRAQAQTPQEALSEFDWFTAFTERNYPGYGDKVSTHGAEWDKWKKTHRDILEQRPDTLPFVLHEYLQRFRDGHLYLQLTSGGIQKFRPVLERMKASGNGAGAPRSTNMYYTAKPMNDSTFFLRIPSFAKNTSNEMVENNRHAIMERPYLIIDLRCNRGGDDRNFQRLLELLYSRPYRKHGVEMYCTQDFLDYYCKVAKEEEEEEDKEYLMEMADSIRKHLGGYALRPGRERVNLVKRDSVYKYPRKVGILIHGRNASSAEQFILEAKESDKVFLFGNENTRGCLDLSNVIAFTSPSGWFTLYLPTTRSCRLPDTVIDGIGIAPQISVPFEESLQEKDNIGEEIRYIEQILRGDTSASVRSSEPDVRP